ncbi:hypothetical protein B0H65DRAFT_457398 [Neurospora tetraspora]|uniref:Uncharacterized protein n=1 Tax=Neurospora tetraspora TaxID=94610 RepID=A0AAE0JKE9_9PEZI|nr:hypothetical protein B0H65DRAFT_457398 [Neurospora tetraspora]
MPKSKFTTTTLTLFLTTLTNLGAMAAPAPAAEPLGLSATAAGGNEKLEERAGKWPSVLHLQQRQVLLPVFLAMDLLVISGLMGLARVF